MPIYRYVCGRCKKYYEYLHVNSEDNKSECPYCGSRDGKKQVANKVSGVVNGASARNNYGLKRNK